MPNRHRERLTVLSVGYPLASVTADPPGGAEQVLAQLDRSLVAAGYRSIVIAPAGSTVTGELVPLPTLEGQVDDSHYAAAHAALRAAIATTVATTPVDLIHFHGVDYASYLPAAGPPALVTLHMPLPWYPARALTPSRADVQLVPVSADQAARAPVGVALLPPIANGVDPGTYRPSGPKRDFALVIGRVAPEKGFHDAVAAARVADMPLVAAGRLFPYDEHHRYFRQRVQPALDSKRRFIGPVEGEAKRRLLARSRAVLIPSTAPETSSLVAMEALASGTPVIAYRSGALPSIVEHGVTGFLVDDVRGMARALRQVDAIDPAACRAAAVERFSVERTAAEYLDLYHRLAA